MTSPLFPKNPRGAQDPSRPRPAGRQASRRKAFSLIEILASLSIFSLIGVLYTSVTDNISQSVSHSNRTLHSAAAVRLLNASLTRDLARLLPSDSHRPSYQFQHGKDETVLALKLRAMPRTTPPQPAATITYHWSRKTGQVRRHDPQADAAAGTSEPAAGTLLAENLTGLTLRRDREIPAAPALRLLLQFPSRAAPPGTPDPLSYPVELLIPLPGF